VTVAAEGFVNKVNTEARGIHVGRLIAVAFAAVFFAIGWLIAKAFLGVAWVIAAIKVGWLDAGGPGRKATAERKRVGGA
jgi:hypothetical protein